MQQDALSKTWGDLKAKIPPGIMNSLGSLPDILAQLTAEDMAVIDAELIRCFKAVASVIRRRAEAIVDKPDYSEWSYGNPGIAGAGIVKNVKTGQFILFNSAARQMGTGSDINQPEVHAMSSPAGEKLLCEFRNIMNDIEDRRKQEYKTDE